MFGLKADSDLYVILGFLVAFIMLCVVIPALIHYGYVLYKVKSHWVLKTRYANITLMEGFSMIIGLSFGALSAATDPWYYHNIDVCPTVNMLHRVAHTGAFTAMYATQLTYLCRFWLLFFTIRCSDFSLNNEWHRLLDPSTVGETNWFVTHKSTFGNEFYSLGIGVAWWIVYVCFFVADQTSGLAFEHAFVLILGILPTVLLLLLYRVVPIFDDHISLKVEMRYIAMMSVFVLILWIPIDIAVILTGRDYEAYVPLAELCWLSVSVMYLCTFYIATKWIIDRLHPFLRPQVTEVDNMLLLSLTRSVSQSGSDISMPQILSHSKSFEYFIIHLSKEFCAECLLSFTEFLQYQEYAFVSVTRGSADNYDNWEPLDHLSKYALKVELPMSVPKSSIVYTNPLDRIALPIPQTSLNTTEFGALRLELKLKSYALYQKYIKNGAQFEINIAYRTRMPLINAIGNKANWISNRDISDENLIHIFDHCIKEMYHLMIDAFTRFRGTTVYNSLDTSIFTIDHDHKFSES